MLAIQFFTTVCSSFQSVKHGGVAILAKQVIVQALQWLQIKAETKGKEKYTNLVVMENTCFMLQELNKLSKLEKSQMMKSINYGEQTPLDQAIKETRIIFTKAFKAYCNEQYMFNFVNLLYEEKHSKGGEEVQKIYTKWFQKKEYAHQGHNKMMKRIKKHL